MLVLKDRLNEFVEQVFIGCGVSKKDAKICADVLVSADLQGFDSHGVQRLKMYYDRICSGMCRVDTAISIIRDEKSVVVLDGGLSMGHVVAEEAMRMAIEKAKEYGTGAVAVRNSTHFGIAGYYAQMAIDNDMIGVVMTNTRPSISPTHGVEPMLGTNPLTVGAPTDEEFPFLLDCATSIIQRGHVELSQRLGKNVPRRSVINSLGEDETDPTKILEKLSSGEAALLPFGGYKGYGYATFVEIMSAALQDGVFLKQTLGKEGDKLLRVGHFFLAIDVAHFISPAIFKKIAGSILRDLRASKKIPGQERIFTAGEKEYEMKQKRVKEGIELDASIMKDFVIMRDELGLVGFEDFSS